LGDLSVAQAKNTMVLGAVETETPDHAADDATPGYAHPATPELFAAVAVLSELCWGNHDDHVGTQCLPPLWPMLLHAAVPDPTANFNELTNPNDVPLWVIPHSVEYLSTGMRRLRHHGVVLIRKVLSVEKNPPINEVVAAGAVAPLARLLQAEFDVEPKLQFEAAWALSNIAAGNSEQTAVVLQANVVALAVRLLYSTNNDLAEQVAWMLGNLAGDNSAARDLVTAAGAMDALVARVDDPSLSAKAVANMTWTMSNLCRGKPHPRLEAVKVAIPPLAGLCVHKDEEVSTDALWALSYIADFGEDALDALLAFDPPLVPRFAAALHGTPSQLTPALRALGNLVTGNSRHTRAVTELGFLNSMPFLLAHHKRGVQKEGLWTLSNILADDPKYIAQVLAVPGLWQHVLTHLEGSANDLVKEAAWCVSNAITTSADDQMLRDVIRGGGLDGSALTLHAMLRKLQGSGIHDARVLGVLLEGIEAALSVLTEEQKTQVAETVEPLQEHVSQDVYSKALSILQALGFDGDAEGEQGEGSTAPQPRRTPGGPGLGFTF
jgi:importin subunit alpha-1